MKIRINLTEAKKAVDPKQVDVDKKAEAKKVADKKKDDKNKVEDKKKKATKAKLKESLYPVVRKMLAENDETEKAQLNESGQCRSCHQSLLQCPECGNVGCRNQGCDNQGFSAGGNCESCGNKWGNTAFWENENKLNEIDPGTIDWSVVAAALGSIGLAPFAIDKIQAMWKKKFPKSFEKAQALSGAIDRQASGNAPGDKDRQIKPGQF
jgi:hypothetical protein